MQLQILQATTSAHMQVARSLFNEYAASLNFSLCFQSFEKELASLPGDYAPPAGRLLLAFWRREPAGCGALHKFLPDKTPPYENDNTVCEMKRLYVKPRHRGHRIGLALAERLIREARETGYRRMLLDTIPESMATAVKMYRRLGFREIVSYRPNPVPGAIFMELDLLS
ncbi:MAG TPA: GNAT family N-acetyltransferase [Terriglobales bacterium]|jgi:GNAT superfamily N-acetyltransferase|nr:GNAT family N-acetyltransferase [Terriglobales bacterium]